MDFSETVKRCSTVRAEYSALFQTPTSYSFVEDTDGVKVMFLYNGDLYCSKLDKFSLGMRGGWSRLSADNTKPIQNLTR
jgi:hypothetical protein